MGNMSYCRFTNTASDLRDCCEAMDDTEGLSAEETTWQVLSRLRRVGDRFLQRHRWLRHWNVSLDRAALVRVPRV